MVTIINQPSVQKDGFLTAVLPDVIKTMEHHKPIILVSSYMSVTLAKKSSSVFVKNG